MGWIPFRKHNASPAAALLVLLRTEAMPPDKAPPKKQICLHLPHSIHNVKTWKPESINLEICARIFSWNLSLKQKKNQVQRLPIPTANFFGGASF
jgi:hypothetical protein